VDSALSAPASRCSACRVCLRVVSEYGGVCTCGVGVAL
jgi:hypothetical protein